VPTIVVPFRPDDPKRRLAVEPGGERVRLAEAMLADVLAAARDVGDVVLADRAGGQGVAVAAALAAAADEPCLVVNADLPCATVHDLRALAAAIPRDGLAVVAAADGTTNALGLSAPRLFAPLYGAGSAGRFAALFPSVLVDLPNLADDVDTLDDLARLEARAGPHTRAVLAALRGRAAA